MKRAPNGTMSCRGLLAALGLVFAATGVQAQDWKPTRHVEFLSGSGAGSNSDGVIRTVERLLQAHKLIEVTSSVVNKPGAGGNIAWTWLNQQPGDGYNITLITGNLISNYISGRSTLHPTDLACTAQLFSEYTAVGVRADSPIKDAKDLMARWRTDPAALSVSVGTAFGGSGHIALALAMKDAGADPKKMKAVVFKAFSQGLAALYGGHVDMVANPHSSFLAPLREGKMRVLAIAAPQRLGGDLATIPTWKELGVDAEIEAFRAMAGPKTLGKPQIAFWESALKRMVQTQEWKEMLEKRAWVDRFSGAQGCQGGLKRQYEQMHAGLAALGLAKN